MKTITVKTKQKKSSRKQRDTFQNMGRTLDREAERLITYLNDEVVPAVRERSSRGMRVASQKLAEFADYLDRTKNK